MRFGLFLCFSKHERYSNDKIIIFIERIKREANQVFKSKIIKDYCLKNGISLHFYAQYGRIHNLASKQWTKKIY